MLQAALFLSLAVLPPTAMTVNIEVQPPLTHRKTGPGIVLVLPDEPRPILPSAGFFIDPLPAQKWAEEGFCVVAITLAPTEVSLLKERLKSAIKRLSDMPQLSDTSKVGLIGMSPF
jgi:carboxymethylenebutenolidase